MRHESVRPLDPFGADPPPEPAPSPDRPRPGLVGLVVAGAVLVLVVAGLGGRSAPPGASPPTTERPVGLVAPDATALPAVPPPPPQLAERVPEILELRAVVVGDGTIDVVDWPGGEPSPTRTTRVPLATPPIWLRFDPYGSGRLAVVDADGTLRMGPEADVVVAENVTSAVWAGDGLPPGLVYTVEVGDVTEIRLATEDGDTTLTRWPPGTRVGHADARGLLVSFDDLVVAADLEGLPMVTGRGRLLASGNDVHLVEGVAGLPADVGYGEVVSMPAGLVLVDDRLAPLDLGPFPLSVEVVFGERSPLAAVVGGDGTRSSVTVRPVDGTPRVLTVGASARPVTFAAGDRFLVLEGGGLVVAEWSRGRSWYLPQELDGVVDVEIVTRTEPPLDR